MATHQTATTGGNDHLPTKHLELYVHAGKDGESYGACTLCQQVFMVLMVKAQADELSFTVTTVNMAKPPAEFKRLASRLPVIVHGTEILADPDEVIQYINEHFPYPPLAYDNARAAQATVDVFSRFSFYVKDVSSSSQPLLVELTRMSEYLDSVPHRFLCRDEFPDHLDCMMLPKLQHLRVVCQALKGFTIPSRLKGLWTYLATAYNHPVFRQTCPSDQEILQHWLGKPELPKINKEKEAQLLSGQPYYSFDVPPGISPKARQT